MKKSFLFSFLFAILISQFAVIQVSAYDFLVIAYPTSENTYPITIPTNEISYTDLSQRYSSFNFLAYPSFPDINSNLLPYSNYSLLSHVYPSYSRVETYYDTSINNSVKVAHIFSTNQSTAIRFSASNQTYTDSYFFEIVLSIPDSQTLQRLQMVFGGYSNAFGFDFWIGNGQFCNPSLGYCNINNVDWTPTNVNLADLNMSFSQQDVLAISFLTIKLGGNDFHSIRVINFNTNTTRLIEFYMNSVDFNPNNLEVFYSHLINSNFYLHCLNSNFNLLLNPFSRFNHSANYVNTEIYSIDNTYYPFQFGDNILPKIEEWTNFEDLEVESFNTLVFINDSRNYGLSNGLNTQFLPNLNISKEFDVLDENTMYVFSVQRNYLNANNFSLIYSDGVREVNCELSNNALSIYIKLNETEPIYLLHSFTFTYYKEFPISILITNQSDYTILGALVDSESLFTPIFPNSFVNNISMTLRNNVATNNSVKIGLLGKYPFNLTTVLNFDKSIVFTREFNYSTSFSLQLPYFPPRERYLSYFHYVGRYSINLFFTFEPSLISEITVQPYFFSSLVPNSLCLVQNTAFYPNVNIYRFLTLYRENINDYPYDYIFTENIAGGMIYDFKINTKYENVKITVVERIQCMTIYRVDELPPSFLENIIAIIVPLIMFFIIPLIFFKKWGKIGAGVGLLLSSFINYLINPTQIIYNIIIILMSLITAIYLFKTHKRDEFI